MISVIFLCSFAETLNSSRSIFSGLVYLNTVSKATSPLSHDLSKEFGLELRIAASPEQPKKYIDSLTIVLYGILGPT